MKMTPEQKSEWIEAASALLAGDPIEFQTPAGFWHSTGQIDATVPHRRKPKPDPLAELKAAHAAGKRVEIRTSYGWSALADPVFNAAPSDYRIAPWTLPEPPEGQQWHRTDWTEDMLIGGWRPLLSGEARQDCDEWTHMPVEWRDVKHYGPAGWSISEDSAHHRTRRPLPTPPHMVPLEACDVPPASQIRHRNQHLPERMIISKDAEGVIAGGLCPSSYTYAHLREYFEILRPGETEWKRCEKEAK